MSSTLKDRIHERLEATGMTNAELAKACNVKQPTSFNWASGKTKKIKGTPLLLAAHALGVTPEWLDSGSGKKFPNTYDSRHYVNDSDAPDIQPKPIEDPWILEAIATLKKLDDADRRAAVLNLRTFVQQIGPPGAGQALPVAEKSQRAGNGK